MRHAADYAPLIDRHPRLTVMAVAESADAGVRQQQAADALAHSLRVPTMSDDAGLEAIGDGLVVVTSEPTRHASLAGRALSAGCHVLVDKPVATSFSDAARLRQSAQAHPSQVAGYVHRLFHPALERLRAVVDSGRLGTPLDVRAIWVSTNRIDDEGGDIVVDPTLSGGGEIRNFLGYPLEAILWAIGLAPRRVYAQSTVGDSALHRSFEAESLATICVEFEAGVTAAICVGRGPAEGRGTFTLSASGTHGSLQIDEARPAVDLAGLASPTVQPASHGFDATFTAVLDDVVAAIGGGRRLRRSLVDGCEVAELIDLAVQSDRSGMPLTV
jgi:predicted dehydrogenase